jgi:fructose-specific phosphotransferase system IIA component
MTLFDLLLPDSVRVPLEASDREAAIALLVEALALPGELADRQELRNAVLVREKAGSTGIGNGVAIPHARSPRAAKPLLAVGRLAKPIDFSAADAKPVSLVFLLAVPEADPKAHLKVLAALSRMASDAKLLKALNKTRSASELVALISGVAI